MPKILARGEFKRSGLFNVDPTPFNKDILRFDKHYRLEVSLIRKGSHPAISLLVAVGENGDEWFTFDNSQEEVGVTFRFNAASNTFFMVMEQDVSVSGAEGSYECWFEYSITALTD